MAKTRTRTRSKVDSKPVISPLLIGLIAVAAILVVAGLILLGNQSQSNLAGPVDVADFPAMGSPEAPVTMIEFGDYG